MTSAGWDHAAALERVGGDEPLLVELIAIFFEEYPKVLSRLIRSLKEKDLPALAEAAHSLKGSLGYLAASDAEALALDLERASHASDLAKASGLVEGLMTRIEALRSEMISPVKEPDDATGMQ